MTDTKSERKTILRRPATLQEAGFVVTSARNTEQALIAKTLGLPSSLDDLWEVLAKEDNLRLIHYKAPHPDVNHLRGMIFDLSEAGSARLVAPAQSYLPTAQASALPDQDQMIFNEVDSTFMSTGATITIPRGTARRTVALNGTVVRIYNNGGETFLATARIPSAWERKWGPAPTFGEVYEKLGGPTIEEMYPDDASTSYVYEFLLVSPHAALGSLLNNRTGFCIFNGRENVITGERDFRLPGRTAPLKVATVQAMPSLPAGVYTLASLSVEEADAFLATGFSGSADMKLDERLRGGEAINIEGVGKDGKVTRLRIVSPAYAWRALLRGEQSDGMRALYSAYGKLLALDQKAWDLHPAVPTAEGKGEKKREWQAAELLARAMPHPLAGKIHAIANALPKTRASLIDWLLQLHQSNKFRKYKDECERIPQLIQGAFGYTKEEVPGGPGGKTADLFRSTMRQNLTNMMAKERLENIYRMASVMEST